MLLRKINYESNCVKNSEFEQEIPQPPTADRPMAPQGRATQPSRETRKTNQAKQPALVPHSDDRKIRMDIK